MDTPEAIAWQGLQWLAEFLSELYEDFEQRVQVESDDDDEAW